MMTVADRTTGRQLLDPPLVPRDLLVRRSVLIKFAMQRRRVER